MSRYEVRNAEHPLLATVFFCDTPTVPRCCSADEYLLTTCDVLIQRVVHISLNSSLYFPSIRRAAAANLAATLVPPPSLWEAMQHASQIRVYAKSSDTCNRGPRLQPTPSHPPHTRSHSLSGSYLSPRPTNRAEESSHGQYQADNRGQHDTLCAPITTRIIRKMTSRTAATGPLLSHCSYQP